MNAQSSGVGEGRRDLLQDLTIIILSKDRQEFLMRQIKHWEGSSVSLLILDGSEIPMSAVMQAHLGPRSAYKHAGTISERFAIAGNSINTTYAMLASDDDLFLKSGIIGCLEVLELNREYIACMGQALTFTATSKRVRMASVYLEKTGYLNDSNDVRERVLRKMSPYTISSWYAVQRSNVLATSLSTIAAIGDSDDPLLDCPLELLEISLELSTAIQGKATSSNQVTWLRSSENPSNWKRKPGGVTGWFESPNFSANRQVWVSRLAVPLSAASGESIDRVTSLATDGLRAFCDQPCADSSIASRLRANAVSAYAALRLKAPRTFSALRPVANAFGRLAGTPQTLIVGTPDHPTKSIRGSRIDALGLEVDIVDIRATISEILLFHSERTASKPESTNG